MADDEMIRVVGLPDLQRALRLIDKDLPKELAAGLAEAAEIVRSATAMKVPRRSGRAAESLKVRKQQRAAALAIGGSQAPYYPYLEWGNKVGYMAGVGRKDSNTRPWVGQQGRYLYPTIAEKNAQVKQKVDEVLERLARAAGFEQDGKGF